MAIYGEETVEPYTLGYQLEDEKTTIYGPYPCISGCAGEGITEQPEPEEAFQEAQEAYEEVCPGSAEAPEADAGFLCIYSRDKGGAVSEPVTAPTLSEAANEFGVTVPFGTTGNNSYIRGSWTVTG
jgi:hypothetical protein